VIIEGFENPLKNPGFEEAEGTKAIDWECQGNAWGTLVSVTDEEAHSGKNSIKIDCKTNGMTWARQHIYLEDGSFIPGEDHIFSAWVKYESVEPNKGAFLKMEPNASVAGAGEMISGNYLFDDNEWHKINFVFNVNVNTTKLGLLIRLRGAGVIYYDDVSFGPVESMADLMQLESDTFFYTESETGIATAQIDNSKNFIPEGAYVEFAIKDGSKTLATENVPAKRNTVWEFDVMTMKEMKRPYTLEATYKAADGSVLADTKTNEIYRYNRAGALAPDGTYMKDGEPFYPYIAYETIEDYTPLANEIGINVMRSYSRPIGFTNDMDNIKKMLDDAQEKDLMVAVALYANPAGHPTMLERTRKIVSTFKDHPAVFAWMIMDEPSLHTGSSWTVRTYEEMVYWLKQSFIEIRAIDDYHPVYVLETLGQVKNPILYSSRNCDVFVTDPYPMYESQIPTWVGERTAAAVEAVRDEKPVYVIQGTYKMYSPAGAEVLESANDARHQLYQAALAGASGLGLYGFTFETDLDNPTGKMDMYSDKEIWEGYKQIKESGELFEIQDHFMAKNSPMFNKYNSNDYRYYSWLKNGELYTVVMNMTTDNKTISVDLTSANGRVAANGFAAEVINGSDMKPFTAEGNTLAVDLGCRQVILFKITPNNELDANALSGDKYDDLNSVAWAKDAIEMLGKEGIVNDTGANLFTPERNITRGEFAYFLMNTLGISDTSGTAQFDDVDKNAFYADAILVGKKAGILLGSGGGVYNPEEGISRQDAMTICARAMKKLGIIGVADSGRILGGFADNDIIADYAAEHIASMVDENIVKGNPDGTVNPLGNITRAEAAVIMERILNLG
ncbi:MAG: S-layer homology domain-containing protein, partial [Clostridia bacterium]|nr:S-layer homology domain-containing protein [Clostridia bacterium]